MGKGGNVGIGGNVKVGNPGIVGIGGNVNVWIGGKVGTGGNENVGMGGNVHCGGDAIVGNVGTAVGTGAAVEGTPGGGKIDGVPGVVTPGGNIVGMAGVGAPAKTGTEVDISGGVKPVETVGASDAGVVGSEIESDVKSGDIPNIGLPSDDCACEARRTICKKMWLWKIRKKKTVNLNGKTQSYHNKE